MNVIPIPISASPDVVDSFTEELLSSQGGPSLQNLTPMLIALFGGSRYFLAWYDLEEPSRFPLVTLGISGLELRIFPDTLEQLQGKHLVFRSVKTLGTRLKRRMIKAIDRDS